MDKIKVFGAKEHNLKSVDLEIPKNSLVVFTGPSGSGKSSLAMDTLYMEGRRRYVESLSAYARQFLGTQKKPSVDKIEGLCPSIAIEQKTVGYNPRSTVGTTTEIYDYLRVLFAKIGKPFCPSCHKQVFSAGTNDEVISLICDNFLDKKVYISALIANEKKGEFKKEIEYYFRQGYSKFFINEKLYEFKELDDIYQVKLKKTLRHTIFVVVDFLTINKKNKDLIFESAIKAMNLGRGSCHIILPEFEKVVRYSTEKTCFDCGVSFDEIEPRMFSFNSPLGACKSCNGLGTEYSFNFDDTESESFMDSVICSSCNGTRLCSLALSVKINNLNISELCSKAVSELINFFEKIELSDFELEIVGDLLTEIKKRIYFLNDVGLGYLNLSRTASTLSGGESQRIRLATQVGSLLSGVLYVLDEPSIGLHQRDNDRLIQTLLKLRDAGNTLVVVEHDLDTMLAADYIFDIGPAAGIHGGEIVSHGTPDKVSKDSKSLTGRFLSGKESIVVPKKRRRPTGFIQVQGATKNNLKNIDVEIPLGLICGVTGVSGSGKSSLINYCLSKSLQNYFNHGYSVASGVEAINGIDNIANVVVVDQKSIGRTSRSTPATYLGIYTDIRNLFGKLPESQVKGLTPGSFSFNVSGGRCEKCSGDGKIKIYMQFLDDVIVECRACKGLRYDSSILEVKFKGKNIAEVLKMSVEEGLEFFKEFPRIAKRLKLMCDVGLDYITLGQPTPTISGGEAQRIKLVNELSKRGSNTLYILDEPTTGLHFDDIRKLLATLNRLVDVGNSVVVIEHNLDVIKSCDYLIDIGPEGGQGGGEIVFTGLPEDLAKCTKSYTGKYLKKIL